MTSEFGTFRLTYEPPSGITSPTVEMVQTGDSTLPEMLYLFEAFLQASGFVLKGELQIVEDTPDLSTPVASYDFGDDGFSLTGMKTYVLQHGGAVEGEAHLVENDVSLHGM